SSPEPRVARGREAPALTRPNRSAISLRQDDSCSFDYLVGAREQWWRHFEAERFSGLEIDHQLVFGRCLHRQIGGFLALEDAIDVACRAPKIIDRISSVGHQAAVSYEVARIVDRRQFVPGRKPDDQIAMDQCQRAPRNDQAAVRAARESRNRALDLTGIAHVDWGQFDAERWGHGLDCAELANSCGYGGITYDGDSRQFRHHQFEQLQPFGANTVFEIDKAGRVAARP